MTKKKLTHYERTERERWWYADPFVQMTGMSPAEYRRYMVSLKKIHCHRCGINGVRGNLHAVVDIGDGMPGHRCAPGYLSIKACDRRAQGEVAP